MNMSCFGESIILHKISESSVPMPPASGALWPSISNPLFKLTNDNEADKKYKNGSLVKGTEYVPKDVHDYIELIKLDDICEFLKRRGISYNKLTSDDGKYFIIDKSIADIFNEAGVDSDKINYEIYDDWYITGLINDDGSICYSMIKVREPMDEQGNKAASVVFNSMSIDSIEYAIACAQEGKTIHHVMAETLYKDLESISNAADHPWVHSKELVKYFKDSESDGSYLIADFIVDKLAHDKVFEGGGTYKLPFKYEEFDDFGGKATLDKLAKAGVYDKAENSITIKDPDNLTDDERTALLLIQTGDSDKFAYAAENQYHADNYSNILFKSHTIVSDAGVGESENGKYYEGTFKTPSGKYYKNQIEEHGDK